MANRSDYRQLAISPMGMSGDHRHFSEFFAAYVGAALWSSYTESEPNGGETMDQDYDVDDIAAEAYEAMRFDCLRFWMVAGPLIFQLSDTPSIVSSAGHDLWLTRNRHGAGYWDGDWPNWLSDRLTPLARSLGEVHLVVGDDTKIHCERG